MDNATTFGAQAQVYAAARPGYPQDLFDWIAGNTPKHELAWDVGTGSGQAASALSKRFAKVHATDLDAAQIAQAPALDNVTYSAAPAHMSGLPDCSADAVTVATALHWFDHNAFWQEVQRAGIPGGLFCAWTYHRAHSDADVEDALLKPILDLIDPYWSDGNRLSWRGYFKDELAMPFDAVDMPDFEMTLHWTPAQIIGFARSWSAHKRAREDGHEGQLITIEHEAAIALGNAPRTLTLPLNTLAGRIA